VNINDVHQPTILILSLSPHTMVGTLSTSTRMRAPCPRDRDVSRCVSGPYWISRSDRSRRHGAQSATTDVMHGFPDPRRTNSDMGQSVGDCSDLKRQKTDSAGPGGGHVGP
jgi:hypothetical protein